MVYLILSIRRKELVSLVFKSGIKAVCSEAHKIAGWLLDYFPQESLDKIESLKRSGKLNAELPPRPPSMVQSF